MIDGFDLHKPIHGPQIGGKVRRPRFADNRLGPQHLTVEIGRDHFSPVGDDRSPDAGHRQHLRCRATHAPNSRDQRRGLFQPELPVCRQHAGTNLPVIALEFRRRQARRWKSIGRCWKWMRTMLVLGLLDRIQSS